MRRQRSAMEQLLIDRAERLGHREPTSATPADVKALEDEIDKSSTKERNPKFPPFPPFTDPSQGSHDVRARSD